MLWAPQSCTSAQSESMPASGLEQPASPGSSQGEARGGWGEEAAREHPGAAGSSQEPVRRSQVAAKEQPMSSQEPQGACSIRDASWPRHRICDAPRSGAQFAMRLRASSPSLRVRAFSSNVTTWSCANDCGSNTGKKLAVDIS